MKEWNAGDKYRSCRRTRALHYLDPPNDPNTLVAVEIAHRKCGDPIDDALPITDYRRLENFRPDDLRHQHKPDRASRSRSDLLAESGP